MELENSQVCPWCSSEIIWDEELGPEKYCPHCNNELGNYRSLQVGADEEMDEEEESEQEDQSDDQLWKDEEDNTASWMEDDIGYRTANRNSLAMDSTVQKILDDQDEMPECPSCREFMLEVGVQKIKIEPTISPVIQQSMLGDEFSAVWYVCPSCFHTSSLLVPSERLALVQKLATET